ncbi:MAG: hypothetical protein ACYTGW_12570 [Planctomycetota bacterium]|jgi:hypothetical protein
MVSSTTPRCGAALMVLLGLGLSGCQTTTVQTPSTPAELLRAEDDLLKPLRARSIVIANNVVVQISPNFYEKIGQPPGGVRRSDGQADEIIWDVRKQIAVRQPGDHSQPGTRASTAVPLAMSELEFIVEGTIFLVTGKLRLRILHQAPPTLQISARGDVRLLTERAMKEQRFIELRFDQGRVRGRRHKR